jgi:DNA-binding MarR family transcriptional regulator
MYDIGITTGILEKKHREAIGSDIWIFMWCVNKVTKKDGLLLGGKPIKLREIGETLGYCDDHVSRALSRLRKAGYLEIIRTPYGLRLRVCNSKKLFRKRIDEKVESLPTTEGERIDEKVESVVRKSRISCTKKSNLIRKNSKKEQKTIVAVKPATPESSFSTKKEVEKLLANPKRKDLRIIGLFLEWKGYEFANSAQYQLVLKRNLPQAKLLRGYTKCDLETAFRKVEQFSKQKGFEWTLETVGKMIPNIINKNYA